MKKINVSILTISNRYLIMKSSNKKWKTRSGRTEAVRRNRITENSFMIPLQPDRENTTKGGTVRSTVYFSEFQWRPAFR